MQKQTNSKPTDFLKPGKDPEFEKAMNSITDMYDDLFKTTDYYNRQDINPNNLDKFEPIEQMWNEMMDIQPPKQAPVHQEVVMGEPVDLPYESVEDPRRNRPAGMYLEPLQNFKQQTYKPGVYPGDPYLVVSKQKPSNTPYPQMKYYQQSQERLMNGNRGYR